MISKKELAAMCVDREELLARKKEIDAALDRIENGMKSEMERRGVTELEVGERVIRWTPYVSQRFDSTGFRKADPETYRAWVKEVKGHRFSVA